MKLKNIFLSISLAFGAALACTQPTNISELARSPDDDPDGNNDPSWFGISGSMKPGDVPESYHLEYVPWPGDYWATDAGGIAHRWQGGCANDNCLFDVPSKDDYMNMSKADLDRLSPAEKYDLYKGRYDLSDYDSATGRQHDYIRWKKSHGGIEGWEGICNGWSLAALYERQPQNPVTVKNPDGLEITFYEGDLKALMSQVYFDYQPNITVTRLGNACFDEGSSDKYACEDINPMTWVMVLGKYLAKGKPFVMDKYAGDEVWNQPIYGYKDFKCSNERELSAEPSYENAATGTKYLVDCSMTVEYVNEGEPRREGYSEDETSDHVARENYRFTLELNRSKKMVGGEWTSSSRPDFIWKPSRKPANFLLGDDYPIKYTDIKSLFAKSLN